MLTPIPDAIAAMARGQMLILVDDENRENEGDLIIAADFITPEAINFMATHGRGLICLSLSGEIVDQLGLPLMAVKNGSKYETAFTVSIEAAKGVSTGISAADRAHTIKTAIKSGAKPSDLINPGHIFPLRARPGGVLERQGQTEGSVDLARLAGLTPAAVICEIMNPDGTMARMSDLEQFASTHQLPIVTIQDLIEYRLQREQHLVCEASSTLPMGDEAICDLHLVRMDFETDPHHLVLVNPQINPERPPLVRIHSECLTGDALGSMRCDCGLQLQASIQEIVCEGGVLIYLRQEGRGIGLLNKIKAYALQDQGLDTVEANHHLGLPTDARDYAICAQILRYFGYEKIRLLTNNPDKLHALQRYGIEVTKRIPLEMPATHTNRQYLQTKRDKLGHWLSVNTPNEILKRVK